MPRGTKLRFDEIDVAILDALQRKDVEEPITTAKLARSVSLSVTPTHLRLKRLKDQGAVRRWSATLDARRLGLTVLSYVNVVLQAHSSELLRDFEIQIANKKNYPNVLNCYAVTGDGDYLLEVVAVDIDDYSDFIRKKLLNIPNVEHVRSMIVLGRVDECDPSLPLEHLR